jgi:hypothetical protein
MILPYRSAVTDFVVAEAVAVTHVITVRLGCYYCIHVCDLI